MSSAKERVTERVAAAMRATIAASVLTNERIAREVGLGVVDSQALSILAMSGRPLTAGELSAATELPSSTTTRVIDRLESAGLVRRSADPADRRKVVVEVLPTMMETFREPYARILEELAALHERFTIEELETVARYLEASVDIGRTTDRP